MPDEEIEFVNDKVKILSPREPVDLATYREVGRVGMVGGKRSVFAFLDREFFACTPVFLHATEQFPGNPQFAIGDLYEYGLEPPQPGKKYWRAKDAMFVQAAQETQ